MVVHRVEEGVVEEQEVVNPLNVNLVSGRRGVHVVTDVAVRELKHGQDIKRKLNHVVEHAKTYVKSQNATDMHVKMEVAQSLVDAAVQQDGQEIAVSQVGKYLYYSEKKLKINSMGMYSILQIYQI